MRKFTSPDDLWKYSLAVASSIYVEGYFEQSKILEDAVRMPCTTGGEWLSELSAAVVSIKKENRFSRDIERHLEVILKTAKSSNPYI
jgi:hypothetical protein